MEWFITANANLPVAELQRHIRVETLVAWCAMPPAIAGEAADAANPQWSGWRVHREVIRDGVRFTLPGAAYALQWTLTAGGQLRPGTVGVHCTLSVVVVDAATRVAIETFMGAWRDGLGDGVRRLHDERIEKARAASQPCAPWFG